MGRGNPPITEEEIPGLTHFELMKHVRQAEVSRNFNDYAGLEKALADELRSRDPTFNYECRRCGDTRYVENQVRTTRGALSAYFNVQTERFRVISCARCTFSEFYHGEVDAAQRLLDFLVDS